MVFHLAKLRPGCEITQLTIISIISHPHLRADEQNFFVMNDDPAVINNILVHNWPSEYRHS